MRNGRPLYTEERVLAMFAQMRRELDDMAARFAARDRARDAELAEVRQQLDQLRAVVRARHAAEAEVERLRAIRDASNERDLGTTTLH